MRRLILFGSIAFLLFALIRVPASLLIDRLPDTGVMALQQAVGTLWRGSAQVSWNGQPGGRLAWQISPLNLLRLKLGGPLQWSDGESQVEGEALAGFNGIGLQLGGTLAATTVNRVLAPYDIRASGALTSENLQLTLSDRGRLTEASGRLRWTGGPVHYILSGQSYQQTLPPMVGLVSAPAGAPALVVYEDPGDIPLIRGSMSDNNFVKIGITRHFTTLLGTPWPGSEPDHAVVLEVEQQLF